MFIELIGALLRIAVQNPVQIAVTSPANVKDTTSYGGLSSNERGPPRRFHRGDFHPDPRVAVQQRASVPSRSTSLANYWQCFTGTFNPDMVDVFEMD